MHVWNFDQNHSSRSLEAKKNELYQKLRHNKGFSLLNIFNDICTYDTDTPVTSEQYESLSSLCPFELKYEVYNLNSSPDLLGFIYSGDERSSNFKEKNLRFSDETSNTYSTISLLRNQSQNAIQLEVLNSDNIKSPKCTFVDCEKMKSNRNKSSDAATSNEKDLQISLHTSSEHIVYISDSLNTDKNLKKNTKKCSCNCNQTCNHRHVSKVSKNGRLCNPNFIYPDIRNDGEKENSKRNHQRRTTKNWEPSQNQDSSKSQSGGCLNTNRTPNYHTEVVNSEKYQENLVNLNEVVKNICETQKKASILDNIEDLSKRINHLDNILNNTIIKTYIDQVLKNQNTKHKKRYSRAKNICEISTRKQQEAIYNSIFKNTPMAYPVKDFQEEKNYYYDQLFPVPNTTDTSFPTDPIYSTDAPNYYYGQLSTNKKGKTPSLEFSRSARSESALETYSESSQSVCIKSSTSYSSLQCDCNNSFTTILFQSNSEVNLSKGTIKKHLQMFYECPHSSRSIEIRGYRQQKLHV